MPLRLRKSQFLKQFLKHFKNFLALQWSWSWFYQWYHGYDPASRVRQSQHDERHCSQSQLHYRTLHRTNRTVYRNPTLYRIIFFDHVNKYILRPKSCLLVCSSYCSWFPPIVLNLHLSCFWSNLRPHCSKSSLFVQKIYFDFPRKLSIFLGEKLVKMLWF